MSHGGEGGGVRKGPKSVTYYLNGPQMVGQMRQTAVDFQPHHVDIYSPLYLYYTSLRRQHNNGRQRKYFFSEEIPKISQMATIASFFAFDNHYNGTTNKLTPFVVNGVTSFVFENERDAEHRRQIVVALKLICDTHTNINSSINNMSIVKCTTTNGCGQRQKSTSINLYRF